MPYFYCNAPDCQKHFYSKHSTAKYCCKKCSVSINKKYLSGKKNQYSDHEMLSKLVEISGQLGKTVSRRDIKNFDAPSDATYQLRFGSWNNAIALAKLVPNVPNYEMAQKALFLDRVRKIKPSTRFSVFKRDGFRCQYCGGTPQQGYVLTLDHIVPRAKNGSDEMENLVTSCWVCNIGKSDSTL